MVLIVTDAPTHGQTEHIPLVVGEAKLLAFLNMDNQYAWVEVRPSYACHLFSQKAFCFECVRPLILSGLLQRKPRAPSGES